MSARTRSPRTVAAPATPTPSAPTPVAADLLAGVSVTPVAEVTTGPAPMQAIMAAASSALAAPTVTAPTASRPAATIAPATVKSARKGRVGYPLQPANSGKVRLTPEEGTKRGYLWAKRVAHPTSGACIGHIRLLAVMPLTHDTGVVGNLPVLLPGNRFESHVASDGMPAGTWEVLDGQPKDYGMLTRVNCLFPLAAS